MEAERLWCLEGTPFPSFSLSRFLLEAFLTVDLLWGVWGLAVQRRKMSGSTDSWDLDEDALVKSFQTRPPMELDSRRDSLQSDYVKPHHRPSAVVESGRRRSFSYDEEEREEQDPTVYDRTSTRPASDSELLACAIRLAQTTLSSERPRASVLKVVEKMTDDVKWAVAFVSLQGEMREMFVDSLLLTSSRPSLPTSSTSEDEPVRTPTKKKKA